MTKKEICENNQSFGYYEGFGGLELKDFEYSVNDSIYFVANVNGEKSYHKAKIYIGNKDKAYFKYKGIRINIDDCLRVNLI